MESGDFSGVSVAGDFGSALAVGVFVHAGASASQPGVGRSSGRQVEITTCLRPELGCSLLGFPNVVDYCCSVLQTIV